jgi:hypothetical protein
MVAPGVRSRALRAHPSYRLCSALVRYESKKLVLSLLVAVGATSVAYRLPQHSNLSAKRYSIKTLLPGIQPSSRSPSWNA